MLYTNLQRKKTALALLLLLQPMRLAADEPTETLRQFYLDADTAMSSCVRQVFGSDATRLDRRLLFFENRPDLDFDRTRAHLSRLRQDLHPHRLIDGLSVPPPYGGEFGAVVIVREFHPEYSRDGFLRTFVHELGNLLDYSLHPTMEDPRLMRHYGDPRDPSGDDDTGQRLERCMNALQAFEPGSSLVANTITGIE